LTDVPLRGFFFSMFIRHTISMAQERNRFAPYRPLERSVRGFTYFAMISTCRHELENSGKTGFMRVNWRGFDVHGGGPCTQCAQARELPTDYFGNTNNRTYDFMDEWRRKPGHFLP
jgi:hypothetical protein